MREEARKGWGERGRGTDREERGRRRRRGRKKEGGRGAGKAEMMRNPPGGYEHFSTYLPSPVVIKCHKYNSQTIYGEHNQNII